MDFETKKRLECLKAKQKQLSLQKSWQEERRKFEEEIPDFKSCFEFVTEKEHQKIDDALCQLPSIVPGRIEMEDFSNKTDYAEVSEIPNQNQLVYCICLIGSAPTLNLYTKGILKNYIKTYDEWYYISPKLLMISLDFETLIFIEDNEDITYIQTKYFSDS